MNFPKPTNRRPSSFKSAGWLPLPQEQPSQRNDLNERRLPATASCAVPRQSASHILVLVIDRLSRTFACRALEDRCARAFSESTRSSGGSHLRRHRADAAGGVLKGTRATPQSPTARPWSCQHPSAGRRIWRQKHAMGEERVLIMAMGAAPGSSPASELGPDARLRLNFGKSPPDGPWTGFCPSIGERRE